MQYKKSTRSAKKVVYKRKSYAPRKRPAAARVIRSIVKRELSRNIEDKIVNNVNSAGNLSYYNSSVWSGSIIPLTPYSGYQQVVQGTGQGNRIGNSIRVKHLWFKGILYPNTYNVSSNPTPMPYDVTFYIGYDKTNPDALPTTLPGFFQNGSASVAPSGSLTDCIATVNTDRWKIVKKLTFKVGFSSVWGQGYNLNTEYQANNDYKMNCKFSVDLARYLPKTLKFNDSDPGCSNAYLYLFAMCTPAIGGANLNTIPIQYAYNQTLIYEDA